MSMPPGDLGRLLQLNSPIRGCTTSVDGKLNEHLPHRWIGGVTIYNPTDYPNGYPEVLTTLYDYFPWGYVKDKPYDSLQICSREESAPVKRLVIHPYMASS
ncbi:hypothetical protein TNCV_4102141 [Trichonephila clavipes]|nr:hypothetical protein TNCV_4102141 [Trichonephila clavipes]